MWTRDPEGDSEEENPRELARAGAGMRRASRRFGPPLYRGIDLKRCFPEKVLSETPNL